MFLYYSNNGFSYVCFTRCFFRLPRLGAGAALLCSLGRSLVVNLEITSTIRLTVAQRACPHPSPLCNYAPSTSQKPKFQKYYHSLYYGRRKNFPSFLFGFDRPCLASRHCEERSDEAIHVFCAYGAGLPRRATSSSQ